MKPNKKAEFAVKLLRQYAKESGNPCRGTTDLSPLEQWLICQLYDDSLEITKPLYKPPSNYDNPNPF